MQNCICRQPWEQWGGRAEFYTVAESDKQKAGKAITLGKGPEQPQLILGLKTRSNKG